MAAFAPDYSDLFGSELLSDVTLILEEEAIDPINDVQRSTGKGADVIDDRQDQDAHAVQAHKVLHGHGLALWGCSSFCKAKLESWSSSTKAGKPEILITVPAGQLEAGELLIRGMYAATPDLSGCSQAQLLQLLLLADRYGTCKVLEAVKAAFSSIPTADLQWDTVLAVYSLPPGCAEFDACKGLLTAAGEKLQQELGDLELVWADKQGQKQQLLLELPYRAVLQLLQDPATRVSSENTVFHTIQRWQQHQLPDPSDGQVQLLRKLVHQVRMQHCTQLYVATVMSQSPLAALSLTHGEVAIATSIAGLAAAEHLAALKAGCPVLASYPAWSAEKRPASAMQQLDIEWQLPLQQLEMAVMEHLQDKSQPAVLKSDGASHSCWQGQQVTLQLELDTTSRAASGTRLWLFVWAPQPINAVRSMTFQVAAVASAAQSSATGSQQHSTAKPTITAGQCTEYFSAGDSGWHDEYLLLRIADLSSWSQIELKLREQLLVHADGCLHFKGEVTAML